MNLLKKLEKMQDARLTRLSRIAMSLGRYSYYDDKFIKYNVEQAQHENGMDDAEYYAMQSI